MNISLPPGAALAASAPSRASAKAPAILLAARRIVAYLEGGRRIDAALLRAAMEQSFGGSDAGGAWDWKTAYESCEAATVLFLRTIAPALRSRVPSPTAQRTILMKIAALLPSHTHRSVESEALQQFSTPIALGLAASAAAAGTGLLAILAELAGASLCLNEFAESRANLLALLFPGVRVSRFDAAQIDDRLEAAIAPTVVLMNPPFSALAHVDRAMPDAARRHIASALARLCPGGRLVAITGASFVPDNPTWTSAFVRLQEQGRLVFTAAIDGGRTFSDQIRQRAPARGDKWHLDEVVISIAGKPYWLWRAVDQHGFVLDVLVQRRRDSFAARRLMTKLLKAAVTPPRVMITDKLKSYGAALDKIGLRVDHRQHKGLNNRAENSHQPTRRRERIMKRFKSARQAQWFLSVHDQVANLFHIPYPESATAAARRASRDRGFAVWRQISNTSAVA